MKVHAVFDLRSFIDVMLSMHAVLYVLLSCYHVVLLSIDLDQSYVYCRVCV